MYPDGIRQFCSAGVVRQGRAEFRWDLGGGRGYWAWGGWTRKLERRGGGDGRRGGSDNVGEDSHATRRRSGEDGEKEGAEGMRERARQISPHLDVLKRAM